MGTRAPARQHPRLSVASPPSATAVDAPRAPIASLSLGLRALFLESHTSEEALYNPGSPSAHERSSERLTTASAAPVRTAFVEAFPSADTPSRAPVLVARILGPTERNRK